MYVYVTWIIEANIALYINYITFFLAKSVFKNIVGNSRCFKRLLAWIIYLEVKGLGSNKKH